MTYEDRNGVGPRTFWLHELISDAVTFVEGAAEGELLLRYRITPSGQLGVAVRSAADFDANNEAESLHDRVR